MIARGLAEGLGWAGRRVWPHAPAILIYHRVADPARDQWGISVAPDRFAEQIAALQTVRQVVPLDRLVAIARGEAQAPKGKPLAAVTFDDGYVDNFTNARPVLQRLDCPATIFLVTAMVGANREFWWDELSSIFMDTEILPEQLRSPFKGDARVWPIAADREARAGVAHLFRGQFLRLSLAEIDGHLATLRDWSGAPRRARDEKRVMTAAEVAEIDDALIGIGAHTVSHPSLENSSAAEQEREIAEGRKACEALVNRPVRHFAYPFGRFNAASVRAARRAGFASACTSLPGVIAPVTSPLRLPRIAPGQMTGEALARALG